VPELLRTLSADAAATAIAWSPDGRELAIGTSHGAIDVWGTAGWQRRRSLDSAHGTIRDLSYSTDARRLAAAASWHGVVVCEGEWHTLIADNRIVSIAFLDQTRLAVGGAWQSLVWDTATQSALTTFERSFHEGFVAYGGGIVAVAVGADEVVLMRADDLEVTDRVRLGANAHEIAISPDGAVAIATALDVHVFREGRSLHLEGHTAGVRSVAYSHDGALLASASANEVRLWDRSGAEIDVVESHLRVRLAFHPSQPLLAVAQGDDVRLYAIATMHRRGPPVRYMSAKIVLVGDPGVGKTGLGWRLAHGEFKEHAATHGQQFWTLKWVTQTRDGMDCEAVLWDLAGQPDYRLIHALFLDDADLALVVFDPTRDDDPLAGVEYWLRHLEGRVKVILVAGRVDRGSARLTQSEIEQFCSARGIDGYEATSARTGEGVEALVERVRRSIVWDDKPATVTNNAFKCLKDHVLALRENPDRPTILSASELRKRLEEELAGFSDEEMLAAVDNLAKHGYVARLSANRILLEPERLNNLAASIVLEARRNERGLGSLEEAQLLRHPFPELDGLSPSDRDLLLDSAVTMFLAHNVCFRERDPLTTLTYLVFPALIHLRRPAGEDVPTENGITYTITGANENTYAALVVLLGYTTTFTRTDQSHNRAQYVVGDEAVCGFRVESQRDGELELVLYFGTTVQERTRLLFQSLVESFLAARDVEIQRFLPVVCAERHPLNRAVVRDAYAEGRNVIFCPLCGGRVQLGEATPPTALTRKADSERRTADARTRFEEALFRLSQTRVETRTCFISYAWGVKAHQRWVERFATDLDKSGISVVLDRWEARPGDRISRFIERAATADRVIVVGTPDYARKYESSSPMSPYVLGVEGDLIGGRLIRETGNVFPVLLAGDERSFPHLLRQRIYADFRDEERYFTTMLELLLALHDIAPRDRVATELRELLEPYA
jgi:small GTP-binding protein